MELEEICLIGDRIMAVIMGRKKRAFMYSISEYTSQLIQILKTTTAAIIVLHHYVRSSVAI